MSVHPVILFTVVPHLYIGAVLCAVVPRALLQRAQGGGSVGTLFDGEFTRKKFYLLMGWAPLTFALLALLISPRYLVMMAVCGAAGVAGETIVSLVWRAFFGEPIWTYSHGAVLSGVTSTLNFFPWAVGAFLFHATMLLMPAAQPRTSPASVAGAALAVGTVAWLPYLVATRGRRRFTGAAYAVFCTPIAATAVALAIFCSPLYLVHMVLFAVVGFAFEYGYGRAMSLFFRRSLWTYNRWRVDGGHASLASLALWALGGVYFTEIARHLGL